MRKRDVLMGMTEAKQRLYGRLTGVACWYEFDSKHEYEWARVQRRRLEGKCDGGRYRYIPKLETQWDRAWAADEARRQHKKIERW